MKEYIPYFALLVSILSFLLSLRKFILDEKRLRRKEQTERLQQEQSENENGAYPPRKDKHHKR